MRVTEAGEVDMVLGRGFSSEGWRADRLLREPGTFLIFDPPEQVQPAPGRCFLMSDSAVAAAVDASKGYRPQLDPATATAILGPVGSDEDGDGARDPEAALLAQLAAADSNGVLAADLALAVGKSRAWTHGRLRELAAQGRVESVKGRWRMRESLDR
jgi:hypothetical protein